MSTKTTRHGIYIINVPNDYINLTTTVPGDDIYVAGFTHLENNQPKHIY